MHWCELAPNTYSISQHCTSCYFTPIGDMQCLLHNTTGLCSATHSIVKSTLRVDFTHNTAQDLHPGPSHLRLHQHFGLVYDNYLQHLRTYCPGPCYTASHNTRTTHLRWVVLTTLPTTLKGCGPYHLRLHNLNTKGLGCAIRYLLHKSTRRVDSVYYTARLPYGALAYI